ncbi:hypothetical protein CYMTET_20032 [Cymbomonas tetramitiformis]|uniref:Uncharacterized protein n=1 Tax=Cymbomonas tetramitiformis TaxID=36881 RepID=A0AAE0G5I1_9CHLO|nr:hypothetical protein CYMTET_20032 [Cymbomonas tetramitiformis]
MCPCPQWRAGRVRLSGDSVNLECWTVKSKWVYSPWGLAMIMAHEVEGGRTGIGADNDGESDVERLDMSEEQHPLILPAGTAGQRGWDAELEEE